VRLNVAGGAPQFHYRADAPRFLDSRRNVHILTAQ